MYDLTRPLGPDTGVYPGDPPVRFRTHADYADGYRVTEVWMGTHAGTHVDAPAHFLPGAVTVDALPLNHLVGPARVIDFASPSCSFGPGERLLVRSGWGARWGQPDYFEAFPGVPAELAERMVSAGIVLLGLETPSLHPDHAEDGRLHRLLLGAGIVIVENLANLDQLPEQVFLTVLPLPLEGLDGAPCRAAAWEEMEGSVVR
jgi:arylformamidase